MKKLFFRFVTYYSLFYQFMFFIAVFSIFTVITALLIYFSIKTSHTNLFADVLSALITGDLDKKGYSKLLQTFYLAMSSIVILIWQSVLILKFLNRPDYLRTSNIWTYYPWGYHNESTEKADFLVFRLMNEGYEDLYDVEVKATYRFFHEKSKTFQHYKCIVKNESIPVLSPKMPFRIYIQTGIMKNIRNLYLDPADIHHERAEDLTRVTKKTRLQDEVIIFITGYDSALDQTKSFSCHYLIKDMMFGEFESIEPENGVFTDKEINSKFNQIVQPGTWPDSILND